MAGQRQKGVRRKTGAQERDDETWGASTSINIMLRCFTKLGDTELHSKPALRPRWLGFRGPRVGFRHAPEMPASEPLIGSGGAAAVRGVIGAGYDAMG